MLSATLNQIVQGVLLGGLYALFAIGLSISVGVMRFVNLAHGDMIVLVSFVLFTLSSILGISPFLAALLILPFAFIAGYALQRFLLQRIVGSSVLPVVLVTFGLSIIIQNGLLEIYGPNTRKVMGGMIETATLGVGAGINIGVFPLAVFATAVLLVLALDGFLYRSSLGARIRAVTDDPAAADLIGLSTKRIYAIAMGIIGVTVAIAACFMSVWTNFEPAIGPSRLLTAFEVVVLGGLGSLWGMLAGGILLGIAQNLGAQVDAAWQVLAGHLLFLAILILRPQGLFSKS
jgi:branched-chain amino acid transport system permease protein